MQHNSKNILTTHTDKTYHTVVLPRKTFFPTPKTEQRKTKKNRPITPPPPFHPPSSLKLHLNPPVRACIRCICAPPLPFPSRCGLGWLPAGAHTQRHSRSFVRRLFLLDRRRTTPTGGFRFLFSCCDASCYHFTGFFVSQKNKLALNFYVLVDIRTSSIDKDCLVNDVLLLL